MKVRLPIMIQDPMTDPYSNESAPKIVEGLHFEFADGTELFDGPVTPQVAIVDLDLRSGRISPAARYEPPDTKRRMGRYSVPTPIDIYSPQFIQVSVLGSILKTLRTVAAKDTLGRTISWAFPGEQLLVLPRAGEWANALYDRDTHSLQFFYFANPKDPNKTVYTSLSRDIVAHETGHAIVDGIAPGLRDAITPQSLAIHETLGDLTALLTSFRSNNLSRRVLDHTGGSIRDSTAFSSLAPEFGAVLDQSGRRNALRSLRNDKSLVATDSSRDEMGEPNLISSFGPHDLSQVLSGALYGLMVAMHEKHWDLWQRAFSRSGYVLAVTAKRFQRLIYRAVDYLPPGEVGFLEFARALVAAESNTSGGFWEHAAFANECIRRGITSSEKDLFTYSGLHDDYAVLPGLDVDRLFAGDDYLVQFVNDNYARFRLPDDRDCLIESIDYVYIYFEEQGQPTHNEEIILKLSWRIDEQDYLSPDLPDRRLVKTGVTIVIDPREKRLKTLLHSEMASHKEARDAVVRRLFAADALTFPGEGTDSTQTASVLEADGTLQFNGIGSLLHLQDDAL